MKKNIIIAAALGLICLNNVFAQESAQVNASVAKNFASKFAGASNVSWEPKAKGISLVKFHLQNESWIAYYSNEGDLITSGRKVMSPNLLPIKVKEALKDVQSKYESKFGNFLFGSIFELTSDKGTEYYIPLENAQLSMLVSIDNTGYSDIRSKVRHTSPIEIDKSVIAKKN